MPRNLPAAFREYMLLERRRSSEEGITVLEWQRWVQLKRLLDRQFGQESKSTTSDRRADSVRVPQPGCEWDLNPTAKFANAS